MKTNEYLNNLINQFKAATGTKYVDINSQEFISEFSEWIKSRRIIGAEYFFFIQNMGVEPDIFDGGYEIGKGAHDSIVLGTSTPLITPYSDGIISPENKIIKAKFGMFYNIPVLYGNDCDDVELRVREINNIRRVITQNPYDQKCIRDWEIFHNGGENITVGVFGNTYDKDIESKIRQIEMLKEKMDEGYEEDFTTDRDMYYYAISSNRKIRYKTKGMKQS